MKTVGNTLFCQGVEGDGVSPRREVTNINPPVSALKEGEGSEAPL